MPPGEVRRAKQLAAGRDAGARLETLPKIPCMPTPSGTETSAIPPDGTKPRPGWLVLRSSKQVANAWPKPRCRGGLSGVLSQRGSVRPMRNVALGGLTLEFGEASDPESADGRWQHQLRPQSAQHRGVRHLVSFGWDLTADVLGSKSLLMAVPG